MNILKKGNHKLSRSIGIWTLPRHTCIGAGICKKYCYAKKMENMPNVKISRKNKYQLSLMMDGIPDIKVMRFDSFGKFSKHAVLLVLRRLD